LFLKSARIFSLSLLLALAAPHAPLSAQSHEVPVQVVVLASPEDAGNVLARLKAGEEFATIAKEKSIDPTAPNGGFIGEVDPATLRPELRDTLQNLKAGELSGVVRIPAGYAVLRIMPSAPNASPATSAPANTAASQADGVPSKHSSDASTAPPSLGHVVSTMGTPVDSARSFDLSAAGSIRYAPDVDGLSESEAVLNRFPKTPGWSSNPHAVCDLHTRSLETSITKLAAYFAPDNQAAVATRAPIDVMQAHMGLAQLYAFKGEMASAIDQYEEAYKVAQAGVPNAVPQMEETLGIAHLHKAEMDNDVYRAPGRKCLFPMGPGVAFAKPEDAEIAVHYFSKYLAKKPTELEVKWLLNLAYMYQGKYPDAVPAQYLLPISAFESKEDIGRFEDVADAVGIKLFSEAGGVIVDDFENNGRYDIVTSSFESCAPLHYYHNNGDGTFSDQTDKAGIANQLGGLNIIQTDYNNDGCLDILVLRGAWEFPQRSSLLRGNCDGTFTDVTEGSGLDEVETNSQAGVWADINNDGLLDLFIVNESGPAMLFLNKGNGKFEEIALLAGVEGDGTSYSKGVAAADYDNDGYVDFYVSNLNGQNFLYHNNHDNTFREVAYTAGARGTGKGFSTWFFDYDNDGLPDIFVTSYFVSVDETARTYLGLPHNAGTLKLYKNLGNGKFQDVTTTVGLDKVFMPMGANFGDVDNDGFLDIYLGTGNPSYASIIPNVMLRNDEGKFFTDITTSAGVGELHKGHGVSFADLTNTGTQDIVESVGGATLGDRHAMRVLANPGHDNDWIDVKLIGTKTNRAAIGARIKVVVENERQGERSIYRTVGSGGSFGASPLEQHIGLGKSARIKTIDIYWPASNTHQVFHDVEKDQFISAKELDADYTKLERKPVHLGGPNNATSSASQASLTKVSATSKEVANK
jgi:tetratricopeptide (TPR) repeat protein